MNKRNIVNKVLEIYAKPINLILSKLNYEQKIQVYAGFFKALKHEDIYSSVSFMPKNINDVQQSGQSDVDYTNIAIVIQGPLVSKDNFTLGTVELYRRYYPNVKIIVSTWSDFPERLIEGLKGLGAYVVLNKYPPVNGVGNINYQLQTSLNGVLKAEELEVEYVWKTRSDQRFYNPYALLLLLAHGGDKVILLGGVTNSHYNRAFHISDFMSFGKLADIKLLYSCKFDNENTKENKHVRKNQALIDTEFKNYIREAEIAERTPQYEMSEKFDNIPLKFANPEIIISHAYYCNKSHKESESGVQLQYKDFLKNYITIVDADSLGFFWMKYEHENIKQSYFERKGKLDFARWMHIKHN